MNNEDVEARLTRWRLSRPPAELMRRLHSAAPSPALRMERPSRQRQGGWSAGWPCLSWRLAYAGLLMAWALVLTLRLLTPSTPALAAQPATARNDLTPVDAPAFAATLAEERTMFLTRDTPDPL